MINPIAVLLAGLGGALGSMARYVLAVLVLRVFPPGAALAPALATFGINVAGSFIIGYYAGAAALPATPLRNAFVMAGLCGGFTTFSAFSLQTIELLRSGALAAALGNVALSVTLCLAAAAGGLVLGRG